ncbi:MobA-like NTP transferase domain-containing protein [Limimonas halophila]|uniref:MobA-like NTP transferase domain-containing protein n=1 Tax=Limimonas halophila TaxID=1082479 RepID=A0A1G7PQ71_9PROT|nr:NTP transferase domain-containing protein [Limimonas halophila]SDF88408.1 MobA-like NTP transferase domain-containing protein [Limimonas halophila]
MTASQPRAVALVLAGTRAPGEPVAAAGGKSCKAFVEVGGKPMIEHVLAALDASGRVDAVRVALAADAPAEQEAPGLAERFADGRAVRVAPGETPTECVLAQLDDLPGDTPLLVVTGDHPLLEPAVVRQVLDTAALEGADVAAGFAAIATVTAAYPQASRTSLNFRDGGYSGCNVFALMTPDARRMVAAWRRLEHTRKRPWRMALAIGPVTVALYLLKRLTLRRALDRLGKRVGVRLRPVVVDSPRAPIDVDKLDDLALVRDILGDSPR